MQISNRDSLLAVACLMGVLHGCGTKGSSDSSTSTPVAPTGSALAIDSESSTSLVAAQQQEQASTLNSGDATSNSSNAATLTDFAVPEYGITTGSITTTRACTASSGTATVALTYDGNDSTTIGNYVGTEVAAGTETRVWTNSSLSAGVACTANAKYAKVGWNTVANVNGLQLVDTTTRSRNVSVTTKSAKGVTRTRTTNYTENGSRTVKWATPSGATATTTTTKTVTSSVAKTYTLTKFDGTTIDISGTHALPAATPLVVTVTRDSNGNPQKHLITSGTMTFTGTSSYATSAISNLLYDLTTSTPCTPVSGTITTSIYNTSTDTTPLQVLITTYTNQVPSVATGTTAAAATTDATATDNMSANIDSKCDFVGRD